MKYLIYKCDCGNSMTATNVPNGLKGYLCQHCGGEMHVVQTKEKPEKRGLSMKYRDVINRALALSLIFMIVALVGAAMKDFDFMPSLAVNLNVSGWILCGCSIFSICMAHMEESLKKKGDEDEISN